MQIRFSIKKIVLYGSIILVVSKFYRCPIKLLFGKSCAGCGLTRALTNAFALDFVAAFNFHPLFGIVIVETIYLIFRKKLKQILKISDIAELIILILTILSFLLTYIIRYYLGILP